MILNPEQENIRRVFVRKTSYHYQCSTPTSEFSMEKPAADKVTKFDRFFKYLNFEKKLLMV